MNIPPVNIMTNNPILFTPSPSALVDTQSAQFRPLDWTEVHLVQFDYTSLYSQSKGHHLPASSAKVESADAGVGQFSLQDMRQETQAPAGGTGSNPTNHATAQQNQLESDSASGEPSLLDAFSQLHSLPAPIPPPSSQSVQSQGWDTGDAGGLGNAGHSSSAGTSDGSSNGVAGAGEEAVFFTLNV
ncbi:hypothetical protein BCR44DRAFT_366904 [Catenaria anguillulae PL171]|uniref:Uncharacterized protein n=1 Tax=Catenaria anguillulae PL171 TaxID=765915 RepID=A0A1Y2HDP4_9FUNG|nr:hypothetical protein BCR44DRAFT_366904 [Catenaria anguillulae PL171]